MGNELWRVLLNLLILEVISALLPNLRLYYRLVLTKTLQLFIAAGNR